MSDVSLSLSLSLDSFYRVVPAAEFLKTFASDRSHMKNGDGSWLAPPPSYPSIQTEKATNNIQLFISMKKTEGFGSVMEESELLHRFGANL